MKLSLSILALSVILPATTFASVSQAKDIVLKPINNKIETQACYVAASQGIDAAKTFLKANDQSFAIFDSSVKCNGLSIRDFAQKYTIKSTANEEAIEKQLSTIKLVALDNKESALCVDAVLLGERQARIKHDATDEVVYCNGKTLGSFARSLKNKNVTL